MSIKEIVRGIRRASPDRDVLSFDDGRLNVQITSLDLFSQINSELPNISVINYLYDISSSVSEELRIVLPKESNIEKVKTKYLNYFALQIKRVLSDIRSINIKIVAFLFFGALVLTASYFLESFGFPRVVADSVNIIGGFSIWEAADTFFFARSEKKKEIFSKLRLMRAEWTRES